MIPSPAWQERAESEKVAFVYLLRNLEGKFYLGWTTDIIRRLEEHNLGKSYYTKTRGPWELIAYETFSNIEDAKKRERTLKNNPRMLKLLKKRALATFRVSAALRQSMQVMGDPTTCFVRAPRLKDCALTSLRDSTAYRRRRKQVVG